MLTEVEIDQEMAAVLDAERRDMRALLLHVADQREHDPEATHDRRYHEAARNLRDIAETVLDVSDDLLLQVAMIARAVEDRGAGDLIAQLISARLCAVCFEIEPLADATALLRSITDTADVAQAKAMGSLN